MKVIWKLEQKTATKKKPAHHMVGRWSNPILIQNHIESKMEFENKQNKNNAHNMVRAWSILREKSSSESENEFEIEKECNQNKTCAPNGSELKLILERKKESENIGQISKWKLKWKNTVTETHNLHTIYIWLSSEHDPIKENISTCTREDTAEGPGFPSALKRNNGKATKGPTVFVKEVQR